MTFTQRAASWRRVKLVAATCGFAAVGALGLTVGMGQTAAAPSTPMKAAGGMTLGATAPVTTPPSTPPIAFASPKVKAKHK